MKKIHLIYLFFFVGMGISLSQATLPVNRSTWTAGVPVTGWTDGYNSDYASTCSSIDPARLDGNGDDIIVEFDSEPKDITIRYKWQGTGTTNTLEVLESADGIMYTPVTTVSYGNQSCNTTSPFALNAATRFVKFDYTDASGNMALLSVEITEPSNQLEFTPAPPASADENVTFDITVCATDGTNILTGYTTNIDLTDNSSTATFSVSPSSSVAPVNGCSTFSITPTSTGNLNLDFGSTGLSTINSGDIDVIAVIDPTHWMFASNNPATVFVGATATISVCNTDASGTLATHDFVPPDAAFFSFNFTGSFSVSGPLGSGPCYTFDISFDQEGSQTMFAADAMSTLMFATSSIGVTIPACVYISEVSAHTLTAQRFVELFNPTSLDIDISDFGVEQISQNGNQVLFADIPANTILKPFETYVVANTPSQIGNCGQDNNISGNGDDTYILYDADENILDQYGVLGVDGSGTSWDYDDKTAVRKLSVCCGNLGNFNPAVPDWDILADTEQTPCSHVKVAEPNMGVISVDVECTDAEGWTHYFNNAEKYYLMSVKKNGNDIGTVGDGTFGLDIGTTGTVTQFSVGTPPYVSNPDGWTVMNRHWDLTPTTQPSSDVEIKFPYTTTDYDALVLNDNTIAAHTDLFFYKLNGNYDPDPANGHSGAPEADAYNADGFWQMPNGSASTFNWAYENGITGDTDAHIAHFSVGSFSGGGGGGNAAGNGALPIDLIAFNVEKFQNKVKINWSTSSEINNDFFMVEHSVNGVDFIEIGKRSGSIHSTSIINYAMTHDMPEIGLNYYRLVQYDMDGQATKLPIQSVFIEKIDDDKNWRIYPSIVTNYIIVQNATLLNSTLSIFSSQGNKIYSKILNDETEQSMDLSFLSNGIYFIKIENTTTSTIQRIVKI